MSTSILIDIICIAVITANAVFVLSRWSPCKLSPWLQIGIFSPFLFATGNLGANLKDHDPAAYTGSLLILYTGLIWTVTTWWLVTVRLAIMQGMKWRVPEWLWFRLPVGLALTGWVISTTNPWHGLFLVPIPGARSEYSFFWYANGIFLWSLIFCTVLLSVYRHRIAEFASDRAQMRLCALSSALPTILNATYTLAPSPVDFDPTVVGLSIGTSMLVIAIYRGQLHAASTVRLEEWIGSDPVAGILVDRNHRVIFSNVFIQRLFEDLPNNEQLAPWVHSRLIDSTGMQISDPEPTSLLQLQARPDTWVEIEKRPVLLEGKAVGTVWFVHDETQRKHMDETVQVARKLESLGLIAGGVAHDFNNLLVSINGNAELGEVFADSEPARVKEYLRRIRHAGEQGADLARQLLNYAAKGEVVLAEVDLKRLVVGTVDMLRSSLRGSTELIVEADSKEPLKVLTDSTQIAQILLNLIVNAHEAIGDHPGKICVRTGYTTLDREALDGLPGAENLSAGDYVYVMVEDSGGGIPMEWQARIFDPFFSTKAVGRGLGLSSAIGTIRKHQGYIRVASVVGKGSVFTVYIPRVQSSDGTQDSSVSSAVSHRRGKRAVILDDNETVRSVDMQMLERLGFDAKDADGRLETTLDLAVSSDLLMVDLTMPGVTIREVITMLRSRNHELPIIVVSGYNTVDIHDIYANDPHTVFLQKPFTLGKLAAVVETLLPQKARTS